MDEKVRQNLVDAGCSEASLTTMQQRAAAVNSFAACGSIGKNCSAAYMTASASSIVLNYLIYQVKRGKP